MSEDLYLVGFDLETTDKDPQVAVPVQVGAVVLAMDGRHQVLMNEICDPGVPIAPGASDTHGLYAADVAGKPPAAEVCARLHDDLMGSPVPVAIVGHNVKTYDLPVIRRVSGRPWDFQVLDTLGLAHRLMPEAENHKLSTVFEALGLGEAKNAHDAVADIFMCLAIADALRAQQGYEDHSDGWRQFMAWASVPVVFERVHFGKHKGKRWKDVPFAYVRFITDKFTGASEDMRATIRHHFNLEFKHK